VNWEEVLVSIRVIAPVHQLRFDVMDQIGTSLHLDRQWLLLDLSMVVICLHVRLVYSQFCNEELMEDEEV
jgi:hypothetical protein